MTNTFNGKIILASGSPRRKELLRQLGVPFEVRVRTIDEHYPEHLVREEIALYLAQRKTEAYRAEMEEGFLVITADTIVCLESHVLGKPADEAEAQAMLRALSGKSHEVITAVCIATKAGAECFSVSTTVHFKPLSEAQIGYYITHFKPFDKAGAYGIQEWIGLTGIDRLEGSYTNVVGLPVQEVYEKLRIATGLIP